MTLPTLSWNNNHEVSLVPRRKKRGGKKTESKYQLYELIKVENNLGVSNVENLLLITDRAYEVTFISIFLNLHTKQGEHPFCLTRDNK